MNRILDIDYPLVLGNNDEPFIIKAILGKGASSVTYLAVCNQTEHVLKECNPLGLHMHRDDNGVLIPDTKLNEEKFKECLERFENGVNKQLAFRLTDDLKNTTSNVQAIYRANGTVYIDMTFFNGKTYDQVEDESLYDLLRRMKALTQVIGHYHDMGYLHLDIKPQNIYAIPETPEMVMMFDFDSVVPEIDVEKTVLLSYTDSWAALEQKIAKYRKSICKATDLFAIGEMIFYRVMCRHSNADEHFDFSKYAYDRNAKIFENVNPQVFRGLDELFHKTLCCAPANRIQTTDELISMLDEIIPLANPKEPFLVSTLPTPKEFFIGRDTEIEEIHARLQQSPVLFLHGIGGIGKSELAKQYAKKHADEYDTVVFAPFLTDIVSLIANDNCIQINNFSKDNDEYDEKYYDKKLCTIKELIANNKNRILLIVDNFDTSEDCHLKDIVDIGCRVIITTRADFSDVYAQMDLNTISNPFAIFNEYYKKPLSDAERDIVNEIIEIVCGHTMTVELLAKQMMAGRISPDKMLNKLKSGGIIDSGKEKVRSAKDGVLTMQNTFNHIQSLFDLSNLDENEICVLANLSLVPHTGISAELFQKWCKIDSFDTMNNLTIEGWIRWDEKKDYISLHPVISNIVIEKCNIDNCHEFLRSVAEYSEVNRELGCLPQDDDILIAGISNQLLISPFNSCDNLIVVQILNNVGLLFDNVSYLECALRIYKNFPNNLSCNIASLYNNLGVAYAQGGKLSLSLQYLNDSLAIRKAQFGDVHITIARCLFNIGMTYISLKDYENALKYYNQGLRIVQIIYGENSLPVAQQLEWIAHLHMTMKEYDMALSIFEHILRIYQSNNETDSENNNQARIGTYIRKCQANIILTENNFTCFEYFENHITGIYQHLYGTNANPLKKDKRLVRIKRDLAEDIAYSPRVFRLLHYRDYLLSIEYGNCMFQSDTWEHPYNEVSNYDDCIDYDDYMDFGDFDDFDF